MCPLTRHVSIRREIKFDARSTTLHDVQMHNIPTYIRILLHAWFGTMAAVLVVG